MEKTIQLYCNVDSEGNVIQSIWGEKIHPEETSDHFEMVTLETAENIDLYKLVLEGFKAKLVLK